MAGRFWNNYDDSSDDDPIYSSESDDDEVEQKPQASSKFNFDFDEEEAEQKRTVRSAKDKRFEEIQGSIKKIRNSMKINDWNSIQTEWENLTKLVDKAKAVLDKEGVPRFLSKLFVNLEDFVTQTDADKEKKAKMSKPNAKGFTHMKLKMKKWTKPNVKIDAAMQQYRNTPSDGEEEDSEATAKSAPAQAAPAKPTAKKAATKAKAADSDDDSFGSSDEDEPDAEDSKVVIGQTGPLKGRARWLKKPGAASSDESDSDDSDFDDTWADDSDDESGDSDTEDKKKKKKGKRERRERKVREQKPAEQKQDAAAAAAAPEEKKEEWTPAKIDQKVKELLAKRGTKNYDRLIQVQNFVYLIDKCTTVAGADVPERVIRMMFHLIDAQFDANPNMATHMTIPMWKSTFNNFVKIIHLIKAHPNVVLLDREPELDAPSNHVRGPLLPQLERLDDEFIKSLQFMDPNTQDYVTRVRDEFAFLKLARLAQDLFASRGDTNAVAVMAARRLDHLYYKRERESAPVKEDSPAQSALAPESSTAPAPQQASTPVNKSTDDGVKPQVDIPEEPLNIPDVPDDTPLQQVVDELCKLIYKHGDDKLKRRAMLQQIYNAALHDKFFDARDLMLLSHLQDSISLADPSTQVLYNRALVQLGLAAFRKGRIVDCHNYLMEIVFSGKTKELLAQGINTRYNQEKTEEQQKRERSRQVPYPMHINLDLIECVYLISAMLLEVPNMAANPHDPRKRIISKQFRKVMDYSDRQVFSGPPENSREHVIAASRALSKGDWQRALDLLLGLDIWRLIPKSDSVKAMLTRKVQEEGLHAYLLTYGQYYETVQLKELSGMFELPLNVIHSTISRLILSDELKASFDQPSGVVVFHKAEATRLQYLALQFAEKANVFVESSEMVDQRGGRQGDRSYDDNRRGGGQYQNRPGQQNRTMQNRMGGARRSEMYAVRQAGGMRPRFAQRS